MKRIVSGFVILFSISILFSACSKTDENFDANLLPGYWKLVGGTEIYRYDAGGTGVFWDPADDVTEAEGQAFTWTLDKSDLTLIHLMDIGGNVTKYYTVTELTGTSLKYKDNIDNSTYSYTKGIN